MRLAREEGGTIVLGGDKPNVPEHLAGGYWLNPTIITGLNMSHRCLREEIFGPVVTVTPFDSEEEVVAMANAVNYGLSASVWTSNIGMLARRVLVCCVLTWSSSVCVSVCPCVCVLLGTANRVAEQLEVGTVWINCWMLRDLRYIALFCTCFALWLVFVTSDAVYEAIFCRGRLFVICVGCVLALTPCVRADRVPFGGMKHSGVGREGGEHSIDFYTEVKNVCVKYA